MTIAPMPRDSVKNECPSASRTLDHSSSAKLGRNRNRSASPAPGMRRALTSMSARITSNTGINKRATRSMPLPMPR